METYSQVDIIQILRSKHIALFTLTDLARLLKEKNQQTLYKRVQRLKEKKLITRLVKGKYQFSFLPVDDFSLANFLYQPSYISLESALSFHGLITDFTYQITSLTTQKPRTFSVADKEFSYSQISPRLFWGYEKKQGFLLAEPQKALLDYVYFYCKGLRGPVWDELDLKNIDRKKLLLYARRSKDKKIQELIRKII